MATLTAVSIPISTIGGFEIGTLCVEERKPGLVLGTFEAGSDYPAVESYFRAFDELVDGQVLSLTDQAAETINRLGLLAEVDGMTVPIRDVQIYSDGGASFRYAPIPTNGKHS